MKILVLTGSLLLANQAYAANNCQFQLENDLIINPQSVTLQTPQQELWRIDNTGKLWLNGKAHDVNTDTQQLLQQYQSGVRQQASTTVEVVVQALQLSTEAITQVVSELSDKPITEHASIQKALAAVQQTTDELIVRSGNTLELRGSKFEQLDTVFDDEFSKAISELAEESAGNILQRIGQAMSGSEGSFEQRMESFGQRMEQFGETLEQSIQAKADLLEQKSAALCADTQKLEALETELQQRIPALKAYDLFSTKTDSTI